MNKPLLTLLSQSLLGFYSLFIISSQGYAMTSAYQAQILPFAYYQIDVPTDINLDASIIETGFWGNRFHAYPIASQAAFDKIVKERTALFYKHKIPQKDLDYAREELAIISEVADKKVKDMHIDLGMTRALYKQIKYDNQRYRIVATNENNINSGFTSSLYAQWYLYAPQLGKYIMSKQAKFPATFAPNSEERGRGFLKKIVYTSPETLRNTLAMAIGPVMWLHPDSHPTIHYRMRSKEPNMLIELKSDGVSDTWSEVKFDQREHIKQIKSSDKKGIKELRSREGRNNLGMQGREVCLFIPKEFRSSEVWCNWVTAGEKSNFLKPKIELTLTYFVAGPQEQTQALAVWDQLLGSLKQRGQP